MRVLEVKSWAGLPPFFDRPIIIIFRVVKLFHVTDKHGGVQIATFVNCGCGIKPRVAQIVDTVQGWSKFRSKALKTFKKGASTGRKHDTRLLIKKVARDGIKVCQLRTNYI